MPTKRFAIILAGAGKGDGNDLHEAVLLLAACSRHGATYQCFAPDMEQHDVIDHLTGQPMPERRNVLREAARIARGDIRPLDQLDMAQYDGLLFPGGFGVAKNLCTYALAGRNCTVNPLVEKAIRAAHEQKKPIGALCIAPILLARVLRTGTITLGQAGDAANDAVALGMQHEVRNARQVAIDETNNLFTTPCYMVDTNIGEVNEGVDALMAAIMAHIK